MNQYTDSEETVVSGTECTGLMPTVSEAHDSNENSASLYGVFAAKTDEGQTGERKKNAKTKKQKKNGHQPVHRGRAAADADYRGRDPAHEDGQP